MAQKNSVALLTFETATEELFERFPSLRAVYRAKARSMGKDAPSANAVFGLVLLPFLESALEQADLGVILRVCAYLEDAAEGATADSRLQNLIRIDFGEWLGTIEYEERLAPWLGSETKRICGYVPGLAAQRRALKLEKEQNGWGRWIATWFKRWWPGDR